MPSIARATLITGTNIETPQIIGAGRSVTRVILNFASDGSGVALARIYSVYGVLTDIFIRPGTSGEQPTDNFDITVTDDAAFTLYTNTGIDNATDTHVDSDTLDISVAGTIDVAFAGMGAANEAEVVLVFAEERPVTLNGTILTDGVKGDVDVSADASVFDVVSVAGTTPAALGLALLDDADAATARATLGLGTGAVALDPTPDSDHTFSGPSVSMTAGEDLAFPEVVYCKSDGKMGKADADAAATAPVVAMASATIANNAAGVFILPGSFVRDDTWNWTIGGLIYLSTTAGELTQTAPSGTDDVVQIVGWAYTADVMFFYPQLVTVVVV